MAAAYSTRGDHVTGLSRSADRLDLTDEASVEAHIGDWINYRSAKAAVNRIVHTAAVELARSHKQSICVALHPGTVKTPFTEKYLARHPAVDASEAAENLLAVIDGLEPKDTGPFFDRAGKPVPW